MGNKTRKQMGTSATNAKNSRARERMEWYSVQLVKSLKAWLPPCRDTCSSFICKRHKARNNCFEKMFNGISFNLYFKAYSTSLFYFHLK